MSEGGDLEVALTWMSLSSDDLLVAADEQLRTARATSDSLRGLEERLKALGPSSGTAPGGVPAVEQQQEQHIPRRLTPTSSWHDHLERAKLNLEERGIDVAEVDLDGLLDPEEIARIERRYGGGFSIEARLDRYDVAFGVLAGIAAALTDYLVVQIPRNASWGGQYQRGSPLTKLLIDKLSMDHDNWLSGFAKVGYDRVTHLEQAVEGFGPTTHRVQTFGHDPLIGLVMGTLDIVRGSISAISKHGEVVIMKGAVAPVPNVFEALTLQLLHLFSDAFTRMGLPLPGWSALQLIQLGSLGPRDETIGELARDMYLRGYNSWHFMTMCTSVAAAELLVRGYFGLRPALDPEYAKDIEVHARASGSETTSSHPRFQAIALIAHTVAAAGNAGKLVMYGGNPAALNYAQWAWFLKQALSFTRTRLRSPSEMLVSQASANRIAIDEGWVGIDVDDPAFPRLEAIRS